MEKIFVLHDCALVEEYENDPGIVTSKNELELNVNNKNVVYVRSLYKNRNIGFILRLAT